jgi:acetamidase/formamidase
MASHTVDPTRANLHGYFSRDLAPVLTIDPGDTVVYKTLDAAWNILPRGSEEEQPVKFPELDREVDKGHCLSGPIAIRGAEPGMTLEVKVDEIRVGPRGWTSSGGWVHRVHQRLGISEGPEATHFWSLDAERLIGRNQHGHEVRLRPFMGVMGMPPNEPGRHPTPPPRRTGGKLDCKELVAGSSLFLPIEVPGGLFSVGDGHAAQGDGEVCVTAIECPMDRVVLTFHLHPDLHINMPRAHTQEGWLALGVHEDLDEASFLALEELLNLMEQKYDTDRKNALALASVVVDLRVTQIVNGVQGVHAVLPHGAIS